MADIYLVIGHGLNGRFCHFYDYVKNARREYFLLIANVHVGWLLLVHYNGTSFEVIERKKS